MDTTSYEAVNDFYNWMNFSTPDFDNWTNSSTLDSDNWMNSSTPDFDNWTNSSTLDSDNWMNSSTPDFSNWANSYIPHFDNWTNSSTPNFGNWMNSSTPVFDNWTNSSTPGETQSNLSIVLSDHYIIPLTPRPLNPSLVSILCLTLLLSAVILATIIGNVLVLAAILRERNLQTLSNHLVFSLAVADLLVAVLVMPIGAQYEVLGNQWVLGPLMCEVWTSADVMCCTSSILHLVAIAVDRYRAVANVDYVQQRNCRKVCVMIAVVWGIGFIVSFGPVLGWRDEKFLERIQVEGRCLVSQDAGYQIFATCSSFYIPLVVILFLYWRIYQAVRKRIRHRPGRIVRPVALLPLVLDMTSLNGSAHMNSSTKSKKCRLEQKREKRAAKTLVIITGVFVACWLPFFTAALLMALKPSWQPDRTVFSLFLWLGYLNSTLNPVIYTMFSPDFRKAFEKMVLGKKKMKRERGALVCGTTRLRCVYSVDTVF